MGDVIRFPPPAPAPARQREPITLDEMRAEWRAAQDDMIAMSADQLRIAETLFGDSGEAPPDWRHVGVTADELVSGVRSLHELTGRVFDENDRLREQLVALRAEFVHAAQAVQQWEIACAAWQERAEAAEAKLAEMEADRG